MKTETRAERGQTAVELLLVMATVALVAMTLLPKVTRTKYGGSRISCVNNLKQVGLAFVMWSHDHNDQFPQASTNPGGSRAWAGSPQVFRHFQAVSNELITPRVLTCPMDSARATASDFVTISNQNLSYFVALEAAVDEPQDLLQGDRNLDGGRSGNNHLLTIRSNTPLSWTAAMHNREGNISLADGSVHQATGPLLNAKLAASGRREVRLAIP